MRPFWWATTSVCERRPAFDCLLNEYERTA